MVRRRGWPTAPRPGSPMDPRPASPMVGPDGSIDTTPLVISWINAYDDCYRSLLWDLKELHEAWAGTALKPTTFYGPRIYLPGSVLARHVDRVDRHVIGSTMTIEVDIDRPWPFVIEDHRARVHAIDIAPGEMVLFESSRLPHCRPEPLKGRFYINFFLHYAPAP